MIEFLDQKVSEWVKRGAIFNGMDLLTALDEYQFRKDNKEVVIDYILSDIDDVLYLYKAKKE